MSAFEREHAPDTRAMPPSGGPAEQVRTLRRIGLVLGVGVAGTLDEVVFHQLLRWHTFYVHTTEQWRLVSDGLFHLFSAALLYTGALLLWRARARIASVRDARALLAGTLMGGGGFNLYDGTIQHKLLQLHPVREGVANLLPYDIAWNVVALLIFAVGWLVWRGMPAEPEQGEPS